MSYKVIHFFTDLQDNDYAYNVGDSFPHVGIEVTEDRIKELSGSANLQGKPLIKKVDEAEPKKEEKAAGEKPKKTTAKRKKNAD